MHHDKALFLAHLIAAFATIMNTSSLHERRRLAKRFNTALDDFVAQYDKDSIFTFASYLTCAMTSGGEDEDLRRGDVFSRVFADVVRVRALSAPQDLPIEEVRDVS